MYNFNREVRKEEKQKCQDVPVSSLSLRLKDIFKRVMSMSFRVNNFIDIQVGTKRNGHGCLTYVMWHEHSFLLQPPSWSLVSPVVALPKELVKAPTGQTLNLRDASYPKPTSSSKPVVRVQVKADDKCGPLSYGPQGLTNSLTGLHADTTSTTMLCSWPEHRRGPRGWDENQWPEL